MTSFVEIIYFVGFWIEALHIAQSATHFERWKWAKPRFVRNRHTIMPKKLVWKTKTIRKRVKAPPKQFGRAKKKAGKESCDRNGILSFLHCDSVVHQDGTPCSYYCHCRCWCVVFDVVLSKSGFGLSPITIQKEDFGEGDWDELLSLFQVLVNSKAFIEFLCSCRFYSNPSKKGKKYYFLGVLSSFLRNIAMNQSIVPEAKSANQFVNYCLKWIPSLRGTHLSASVFLQEYFHRMESELREINALHFKVWCSRAWLSCDRCRDPPCLKT